MQMEGFRKAIFGLLCAMVSLRAAAAGIPIEPPAKLLQQTFRFDSAAAGAKPSAVHLAGTFNHWSHTQTPMLDIGNGIYSVTLDLAPGLYHYKFLVNDDQWFADPSADKSLEDAEDHHNCGIIVGVDGRKLPPPPHNTIEPRGLAHDVTEETDVNVATPTLLRLRIRTQANDVQKVIAWYRVHGSPQWQQQELTPIETAMGFEHFGGMLELQGTEAEYLFELINGTAHNYLASAMLYSDQTEALTHPYIQPMQPKFQTPDWSKYAIWYQIFPERFRNGDPSNDPPGAARWQSKWYTELPGEPPGPSYLNRDLSRRRYGGDIAGIQQELPYLRQLGVNAIYLNPIFEADSSHKYDTRDYRHVDDQFGVAGSAAKLTSETDDPATWQWSDSDKIFLNFLQEAHRQGFKVIIDGVFNHASRNSLYFQDVLKNGRASKYADWFDILDWGNGGEPGKPGGLQYASWDGRNGGMVLWNKDATLGLVHGPRELMLAIARRWLAPNGDVTSGVDGFRLDAADRVPHPFWIDWRNLVKSINPQAYISGEIWGWSQPWLSGDQFDAVMNYQFAMAAQSFFVDHKQSLKPTQFDNRLEQLFFNYPLQVVLAQQNLLDSHDTDRFVTRFANPDRGFNEADHFQDKGYDSSQPSPTAWQRDHQAVAFQMTFPGAPMIYYGDEAGMWSPTDPSDRMPMWWKDLEPFDEPTYAFNQQQFDFYQRTIAIRQKLEALQTGSFHPLLIDDKHSLYAFARELNHQAVYVVMNRSEKSVRTKVPVDSKSIFVDWLDPQQTEIMPADAALPTNRPTIAAKSNLYTITANDGVIQLELGAYDTAILAPLEPNHP
jgi:cyclomaltodextrinase / maltogenic alpha-amylase / neopullulanase